MKHYTDFNPTDFKTYSIGKKKRAQYELASDDILTFDIEVSSAWLENGKPIPYRPFMPEEYWNGLKSVSLCYIWQFSFNGEVYYGRELEEFRALLGKLPNDIKFVVWVHNLAYEFEFLCNIFTWESVFARKAHSPMKATPAMFPNIEFRCSYYLTRMSLDLWGKEVGLAKLTGSLDYVKIRTPNTKLTDEELAYCKRDCEVVDLGIRKYLDKYGHIEDIPMTQTGEVRKVVKALMRKDKAVTRQMIKLIPANANMYHILKQTFMGGYTHASAFYAGRTIRRETGYAYDFASSYPAVMCSEMFPMSPFQPDTYNENETAFKAFLMRIEFKNVKPLTYNHYLPVSKCLSISADVRKDNGRIMSCSKCEMWLTEQDLDIVLKSYECSYTVKECYSSMKGYLPKPLVEYVLELYNNKTQYKGLPDKAEIYAIAKQFINSLFGMCVTDMIQDDVAYYEGGTWEVEPKTVSEVDAYLDELRNKNRGRTFLAYQFGVWITAYARHNLWECLLSADEDVIYCDTDSLKLAEAHDFTWYNEKVQRKLLCMCKAYGINPDLIAPVDTKGVAHPLGHFDEEDPWTEFKTLGAKRYCYRGKEDGKLHLTVSGVGKSAVVVLRDDIDNFNEETVFDKDYYEEFKGTDVKDGTKRMHIYHQMEPVTWNEGEPDEYHSEYFQGMAIRPTSYSMSVNDEYLDLLAEFLYNNDDHLRCI